MKPLGPVQQQVSLIRMPDMRLESVARPCSSLESRGSCGDFTVEKNLGSNGWGQNRVAVSWCPRGDFYNSDVFWVHGGGDIKGDSHIMGAHCRGYSESTAGKGVVSIGDNELVFG